METTQQISLLHYFLVTTFFERFELCEVRKIETPGNNSRDVVKGEIQTKSINELKNALTNVFLVIAKSETHQIHP